MRLAEIVDGIVRNVIEVDPQKVPDWATGWIDAQDAAPGWRHDGASFREPPAPSQAEIDAEIGERADRVLAADPDMKAIGEMLWQVAKAAKTGDWTYFQGVNSKADFRDLYIEILRNR